MRRGLAHWLTIAVLLVQGVATAAAPHMMNHAAPAEASAVVQASPCHDAVEAVDAAAAEHHAGATPCCGETEDCSCAAMCSGQAASSNGVILDWSLPSAQPVALLAPQQAAPPPGALIRPPISLRS